MASNEEQVGAVRSALSPARLATYEVASGAVSDHDLSALKLYAWNARVSGDFMPPLHLCEVVIRNAVAEALEAVYGERWPWSPVFEVSLPNPSNGYNPRRDLQSVRNKVPTTGKAIPELKFVFWQKMFTSRFDDRLWNYHLRRVLPGLDADKAHSILRNRIYEDLEQLRRLRNRIAHHEPIFQRALNSDYEKIVRLIAARNAVVAEWLNVNQTVINTLASRP